MSKPYPVRRFFATLVLFMASGTWKGARKFVDYIFDPDEQVMP